MVYLLIEIGYIEEQDDFEIGIVYNFSSSILTGVTAYAPSVSEVLAKYGQPDEVWFATGLHPGEILMRLNLVYLKDGMAVGYVINGDIQDDVVLGCFARKENGLIRLNIPHKGTSYKDFTPIFDLDRRYIPLEEAANLTMGEFIEHFSDPTQPQCIETPIELWE